MCNTLPILLLAEDIFMNWMATHAPVIFICIMLMWLSWWVRGLVSDLNHRIDRIEVGFSDFKITQLSFAEQLIEVKLRMNTLEANMVAMDRRLTTVESKIDSVIDRFDKLIHHLDRYETVRR